MQLKLNIIAALFATVGCMLSQNVHAQTPGYVQHEKIKVSGITTESSVISMPDSQKITTRSYFDGLGRTMQTVTLKGSPQKKDMVQPVVYDNLGMTSKSYLPYTATTADGSYQNTALAGQAYFYAHTPKVTNDDSLYSRQVFENSPLQRLLKAGSVGNGFEPGTGQHYKSVNYRTNTAADSVVIWSTAGTNSGYYATSNLQVVEATDEDGAKTLTFKNNDGQLVLKKQQSGSSAYISTYYVYNEAGAIRNVIPPKAVSLMQASGNWSLSQTAIANLIFSYTYDNQGRIVQKTVPGNVTVYIVYDPLNRPVLVQDNNLRANNKWNYIKYDGKDHPISQGLYTDATNIGLSAMQSYVNGLSYSTYYYEDRSTASTSGYYTNNVFPTSNIEPLAYGYYDDYDLDQNGTGDYSYQSQSLTGEGMAVSNLRGVPTMVRSRTVGQGFSNIWLIKVMFYDKKGRVIQVQSNNQLNSTVADVQTSVPDFTGATLQTKVSKVVSGNTTTVLSTFSYDHMYRMTAIDQSYNGGSSMRVAGYEYNELGQLVKKNIKQLSGSTIPYNVNLDSLNQVSSGNTSNIVAQNSITLMPGFVAASGSVFTAKIVTGYLQAIDYRYNIRGQLININNSKLADDNGATNNDANDLFGMDLLYGNADSNLGNMAQYSGRISAVKWMTVDGNNAKTNERSYKYSYDLLDRLTASTYAERGSTSTGSFNTNTNGFDEGGITYDINGNILTMQRNSSSIGASSNVQVDNLTYTYSSSNPNQLKNVSDGSGVNYTGYGFRNLTGSTADYSYDNAGNLTTDPYKGLTLTYNDLNKTDQITVTTATNRYIQYTYNSGGQLIRKQQYDNVTLQKTTDYIDGFVYENNTLAYFPIPEGRVINNSSTLTPEFVIADQQGNARISFRDDGTGKAQVIQENSYYAFGLTLANSPVATPTIPNKNLYNGGSEWQNDFSNLPDYYNTFFRNYDAALGKFMAADPKAESAETISQYHYSGNNPVMFNDPLGDEPNRPQRVAPSDDPQTGGGSFINMAMLGSNAAYDQYHAKLNEEKALLAAVKAGDPDAITQYVAQTGGTTYKWNPVAGDEINRESYKDNSGITHINIYYSGALLERANGSYGSANQGGGAQSSFVGDNWKDIGFLANDLTQSFINRNTTLAISEGYNLTKSTVFLPLGLATRTSTGALSAISRAGGLVAKAAPWVAAGSIGINIAVNKQVTAGDVYQSIVTGASLVPGWGLIVGGGALLLEGGSYYFTGKSVSDNINSHLNGGVIYSWK